MDHEFDWSDDSDSADTGGDDASVDGAPDSLAQDSGPSDDSAYDSDPESGSDAEPEFGDSPGDRHDGVGWDVDDLADESGEDEDYDTAGAGDDSPVGDESSATPVFGADPDVVADDDPWLNDPFPPRLDLADVPEPVDGYPWSDASTLGSDGSGAEPPDAQPAYLTPSAADLYGYDGAEAPTGGDAWGPLIASEDPATSSLARFWSD